MLLNDWHDDHGGMRVCLKFSSGSTSKCQFHRLLLWIVSQHTKANFHRRSPSSSSSPMSNYHHQCQTMAWPQSLLLSPSSDTCPLISPALSAKLFPIAQWPPSRRPPSLLLWPDLVNQCAMHAWLPIGRLEQHAETQLVSQLSGQPSQATRPQVAQTLPQLNADLLVQFIRNCGAEIP